MLQDPFGPAIHEMWCKRAGTELARKTRLPDWTTRGKRGKTAALDK